MGRFENSEATNDAARETGPKTKLVTLVSGEDPLLDANANTEPASDSHSCKLRARGKGMDGKLTGKLPNSRLYTELFRAGSWHAFR